MAYGGVKHLDASISGAAGFVNEIDRHFFGEFSQLGIESGHLGLEL